MTAGRIETYAIFKVTHVVVATQESGQEAAIRSQGDEEVLWNWTRADIQALIALPLQVPKQVSSGLGGTSTTLVFRALFPIHSFSITAFKAKSDLLSNQFLDCHSIQQQHSELIHPIYRTESCGVFMIWADIPNWGEGSICYEYGPIKRRPDSFGLPIQSADSLCQCPEQSKWDWNLQRLWLLRKADESCGSILNSIFEEISWKYFAHFSQEDCG